MRKLAEEEERDLGDKEPQQDALAASLQAVYAMMSQQTQALEQIKRELGSARTETRAAQARAAEATSQASALAERLTNLTAGQACHPHPSAGTSTIPGSRHVLPPTATEAETPEAVQAIRREMMGLEYAANKEGCEKANAERRGRLQYDLNRAAAKMQRFG